MFLNWFYRKSTKMSVSVIPGSLYWDKQTIGRIRLGCSERKYSPVSSFFYSTGLPHQWLRILRVYELSGDRSHERRSNHVTQNGWQRWFKVCLKRIFVRLCMFCDMSYTLESNYIKYEANECKLHLGNEDLMCRKHVHVQFRFAYHVC